MAPADPGSRDPGFCILEILDPSRVLDHEEPGSRALDTGDPGSHILDPVVPGSRILDVADPESENNVPEVT